MTIRSSTPQTLHLYRTLILRISPDGGGGGNIEVIDLSMPNPNFHVKRISNNPTPTHTMVESAGNERAVTEMILSPIVR